MYAFEKALPVISTTKLEGLKKFYGITGKAATTYFEVHAVVDVVHAAYWEKLLNKEAEEMESTLYAHAEKSLAAQHLLLDSCHEAYC